MLESDEIDVADTEDEVQTLNAVQHLRDSLEDIQAILDGAVDDARSIMEEASGAGPPFFILSSKKLSDTRQKENSLVSFTKTPQKIRAQWSLAMQAMRRSS